ncbi:MAG TPA: hypothetical protein VFU22_21085 [Roseiflexaceae bacterium]|nr:hypothetical protein [Roseiflexaceae bacterium]
MTSRSAQQTQLTDSEVTLHAQWEERVRRYRAGDAAAMPPEVVGLGDLRVFGRAGDAVLAFPRVRALGDLELLPPDVQFGLHLANRTVEAHRRQGSGRMVYATAPATSRGIPEPQVVAMIDPTQHADILIVAPIAGGAR